MGKPSERMWLYVLALWHFPALAALGTLRADMALAQRGESRLMSEYGVVLAQILPGSVG